MNIERDIFKRSRINYNKLKEYGFKKDKDCYIFETILLSEFSVIISIDKSDNVFGKLIDLETHEEYTNHKTQMSGEFVSRVREEYKKLLIDIKNRCFDDRLFIFDQTNRIASYIKEKYDTSAEFLWDDSPGCGVFRNKNTNKWFGIIMNVDYSKLDNQTGEVEVMNVKLDEKLINDLVKLPGYYRAYHMSKKYWISIVLNDTLSDEEIFKRIDKSYELVS